MTSQLPFVIRATFILGGLDFIHFLNGRRFLKCLRKVRKWLSWSASATPKSRNSQLSIDSFFCFSTMAEYTAEG
jgi:hypothetical protein